MWGIKTGIIITMFKQKGLLFQRAWLVRATSSKDGFFEVMFDKKEEERRGEKHECDFIICLCNVCIVLTY